MGVHVTALKFPGNDPSLFLSADQPGDVRVPYHLRVHGALHLRGLPPALHQVRHHLMCSPHHYHCQAPLTDLIPQDGSPSHSVRHSIHPAHLLHVGQLM